MVGGMVLPGHEGPGGSRSLVWDLARGRLREGFPAPEGCPLQPPTHLPEWAASCPKPLGQPRTVVRVPWYPQRCFHLLFIFPGRQVRGTLAVSWHGGVSRCICACPSQELLENAGSLFDPASARPGLGPMASRRSLQPPATRPVGMLGSGPGFLLFPKGSRPSLPFDCGAPKQTG